jgi:hypothetical protein
LRNSNPATGRRGPFARFGILIWISDDRSTITEDAGSGKRFLPNKRRQPMLKFIAVAAFALTVATSAHAMPPAPLHQLDGMTTEVAYGCGAGRTRVAGVCVARTTKRQARRAVRRDLRGY